MAPRLKLFLPLILFAAMALFLFRGLSLDPQALPSALIDKPLPDFTLPVLGRESMLNREGLIGEVIEIVTRAAVAAISRGEGRITGATLWDLGYVPLSRRRNSALRHDMT